MIEQLGISNGMFDMQETFDRVLIKRLCMSLANEHGYNLKVLLKKGMMLIPIRLPTKQHNQIEPQINHPILPKILHKAHHIHQGQNILHPNLQIPLQHIIPTITKSPPLIQPAPHQFEDEHFLGGYAFKALD